MTCARALPLALAVLGRGAIARIDELLGRLGLPPPYVAATGGWCDAEDFRELSAQARWPR
jgi:hypothetical protein